MVLFDGEWLLLGVLGIMVLFRLYRIMFFGVSLL